MTKTVPAIEPALDFDPDRPIAWSQVWQRDVLVVPWDMDGDRGARRAAGLFDREGRFLPEGHCWRYASGPITLQPQRPALDGAPERLAGRWLFGGLFYGHFGHFLCETTSRLWALDSLGPIDGIIFYPKQKLTHERRQYRHHLPFFAALGLTEDRITFRAPQVPVIVEELAIPAPGFGIETMIEGRPEYRSYMRANLGRDIAPAGPDDLYISRARLPAKRGSVLHEDLIEARMAAAGYGVFHPQDHDIATQIATYKAAKRIVSLDASALHLAAMVVGADTKIAIINRGPSNNIDDYIAQFTRWQGRSPTRIEAVTGFYFPKGRRVVKRETHAVLDVEALAAGLVAGGFLPDKSGWQAPSPKETEAALTALADRLDSPLDHHDWAG